LSMKVAAQSANRHSPRTISGRFRPIEPACGPLLHGLLCLVQECIVGKLRYSDSAYGITRFTRLLFHGAQQNVSREPIHCVFSTVASLPRQRCYRWSLGPDFVRSETIKFLTTAIDSGCNRSVASPFKQRIPYVACAFCRPLITFLTHTPRRVSALKDRSSS